MSDMRPKFGNAPTYHGQFEFDLREVMYYLYLPVRMGDSGLRLPENVQCCESMIRAAIAATERQYELVYLSARKGWASPDNPLNRPGWHCDGFGTDDMNYAWWRGPGTRFAIQHFHEISDDHVASLRQFDQQIHPERIVQYPERGLYGLDPTVVHATPLIEPPGCMRQFIKVSFSDHHYNLENNSHNYLFDYDWPLVNRETIRNDTHKAQADYVS